MDASFNLATVLFYSFSVALFDFCTDKTWMASRLAASRAYMIYKDSMALVKSLN